MDKTQKQELEQAKADLAVAQASLETIMAANVKLREELEECQKGKSD